MPDGTKGPSHYLIQCWPRSMMLYGISRPQWVNILARAFQQYWLPDDGFTLSLNHNELIRSFVGFSAILAFGSLHIVSLVTRPQRVNTLALFASQQYWLLVSCRCGMESMLPRQWSAGSHMAALHHTWNTDTAAQPSWRSTITGPWSYWWFGAAADALVQPHICTLYTTWHTNTP